MKKISAKERAIKLFKRKGGILKTGEAIKLGIHPRTLYELRDLGITEKLARGIYRLSEISLFDEEDLITISLAFPKVVICLVSALSFYNLTTQIPHKIDIACKKGSRKPSINYPPIRVTGFSKDAFDYGIETHLINKIPIRIYSPERTIVDCFKFRKKIGLDVAIEALKLYWEERRGSVEKLLESAKICRMEKIIRPYIESIIHE